MPKKRYQQYLRTPSPQGSVTLWTDVIEEGPSKALVLDLIQKGVELRMALDQVNRFLSDYGLAIVEPPPGGYGVATVNERGGNVVSYHASYGDALHAALERLVEIVEARDE